MAENIERVTDAVVKRLFAVVASREMVTKGVKAVGAVTTGQEDWWKYWEAEFGLEEDGESVELKAVLGVEATVVEEGGWLWL